MNRRKEPCRNFQRGSCQYGDRCKFLHVTQQQPKSNPFGFGSQTQSPPQFFNTAQQQKPNPFGFGVQNNSQQKGGAPSFGGGYQSPAKPFENKWTRNSSAATTKFPSSQQADAKQQAGVHKCTDPESCKQLIVEDFKNEEPLWKLTCYGHCKNGACDITGDISYEELRAAAYEDAKKGLPIQTILERERNLRNSKLAEFDNLLRNPYVIRSASTSETKSFPGVNLNTSSVASQSNTPPSFSSFAQLGSTTNLGPGIRPQTAGAPPSHVFGSPNLPQSTASSANFFQQPSLPQNFGQSNNLSGWPNSQQNNSTFGTGLGANKPSQPFGSLSANQPSQPFGSLSANQQPQQFGNLSGPNSMNVQNGFMSSGSNLSSFTLNSNVTNAPTNDQPSTTDNDTVGLDDSIWLKNEWAIGEIPELPPPPRFCL